MGALNDPKDQAEAAEAIRGLIEKITLRPGPERGEIDATLHGELGDDPSTGSGPKLLAQIRKPTFPPPQRQECRSRWLRGPATTETDIHWWSPFDG